MLDNDRLQALMSLKDHAESRATGKSEGWAIIDGALVIYNLDDPPDWFVKPLAEQDEDGHTPAFIACHGGAA